jgi:hypothetical protein
MNMIKRLLIGAGIVAAPLAIAAPAQATTPCVNGICFATTNDGLPFMGYPASTPRNTCKSVVDDQTTWINNTSGYRWLVFTSTNCTGPAGTIYPHSEGAMSGIWYRSIGSTYRTSSTSAAPAITSRILAPMG